MAVLYTNNAASLLSASITDTATSFSVTSGHGALFPAPTGSDYFYVTLLDTAGNIEIVKVTGRSTDTFTITRGQDGTSARAFSVGDKVELRIVRAMLDDLKGERLPLTGGTLSGNLNISSGGAIDNAWAASGANAWRFIFATSANTEGYGVGSQGFGIYRNGNATYSLMFATDGTVDAPAGLKQNGNQVLHAGNYTDYAAPASHTHSYLPLSGGTLTGKVIAGSSGGDSIEVRNDTASAASSGYITFKNKNGIGVYRPAARISGVNVDNAYDGDFLIETYSGGVAYKGLRVDENSDVFFYDTSGNVKFQWEAVNSRALINSNVVLHAGNYSSYAAPASHTHSYLPLSGGTLNAGSGYPLQLYSSSRYQFRIQNSSAAAQTYGWWLAHDSGGALVFHADSVGDIANLNNSGVFTVPKIIAGGLGSSTLNTIGGNIGATAVSWDNAQLEVKNNDAGSVGIALHRSGYTSNTVSVTDGNGIRLDGNIALHAGNYSSYAAPASHTHSYLPLSGGTISGDLYVGGRNLKTFENNSYIEFYVGGDANTYYPVRFDVYAWMHWGRWSISRGYSDTAPWDPIGTGAHHGGLTFTWEWSGDGAWGGNDHSFRVVQFSEQYTTMVGGMALSVNGMIVWLRGGNAYYRFHGPGGVNNGATPYYSTYTASNGATYSPRSYDSSAVSSEISWRFPVRYNGEFYEYNNRVLNASNYSSYALPLSGGTMSGTITMGGNYVNNAGQFNLNNGFTISQGGSNYGQFSSWVHLPGYHGLYSTQNGAHFYPNDADYGAWRISGSRGGWSGLYFDTGSTLMMNSSEVGFHRSGYGWQMWWSGGTGYVHKGSPGGGTQATILDSSNYTNYAAPASHSHSWPSITSGYREDYDLGIRPPNNSWSYAGFRFATPGNDADAGYLLVRGGPDSDVYTQNGITLVADAGWLTLAQRTGTDKGVRLMTNGTTRLSVNYSGDIAFVNGNSINYNSGRMVYGDSYASDENYNTGSIGRSGVNIDDIFQRRSGFIDVWAGGGTQPFGGTSHVTGFQSMHYWNGTTGYGLQVVGNHENRSSLKFRLRSSNGINPWYDIIHSGNYTSYSDGRYVLKSGDTMSGNLVFQSAAHPRVFYDGSSSLTTGYYLANANNNRAWNWQLDENNNAALWGYNGSAWAKKVTYTQDAYIVSGGKYQADAWIHSDRDFADGTLIQTDINYAVTYGDPFILEIRGNSYGSGIPFDIQYQGYIYSDTIINRGGYSNGTNISGLVAINYNGNLCFWFPRQGYWQGFYVRVYVPYASYPRQRVFSVSNSGKPTTAKQVDLSPDIRQSLHSGNYSSYALPLGGGTLTGSLTVGRDVVVAGQTGGNYGNRIVVGAYDTAYTLQDTNLRPTIQANGQYPVLSLNHTVTSNSNHGPTIQMTANGVGNQFVIGMTGNGTALDMGYSSNSDWNPHNGISGYSGTTFFRATSGGFLGLGAPGDWGGLGGGDPQYHLHVKGYPTWTQGYAGVFQNTGGSNGGGWLFQNDAGNHSWGATAEFRVNGAGDRPSIIFSTAAVNTSWSIGYVTGSDDTFRISKNHGHRAYYNGWADNNGGWGTAYFSITSSGVASANGGTLLSASNYTNYLGDYTYGNYRVIADYSSSNTWYIRSNGRFVWARSHDWTQSFELNLGNGTAGSNDGWALFGQISSNAGAGTWHGTRFVQYTGSVTADGNVRAGRYYLGNDSYYVHMGDWGLRNTTPYGWIQFGPANSSWAHIYSSGLDFYFNANLYTNGWIQIHSSNVGNYALDVNGGTMYGNATFQRSTDSAIDFYHSATPSGTSNRVIAGSSFVARNNAGTYQTMAVRRVRAITSSTSSSYGIVVDEAYVSNALNAYTNLLQDQWSFYSSYSGSLVKQFAVTGTEIGPGAAGVDNTMSAGGSTRRYSVVYAVTGTINTSDVNEKEQIQDLDAAERRVAVAVKGLIKKFKWKDAVAKKGDAARIHIGVIAQEVEAAFVAEGLDPERYALFCKDVWWEKMVPNQNYGREDAPSEPETILETFQSEVEGGTRKERKGIRYDQLLAFVISAI